MVSQHKGLSVLLAVSLVIVFLAPGCKSDKNKGPEDPPETVSSTDGLTEINKTREFTLYAKFQQKKVVAWEVHDNEGHPQEIFFEKGAVKGLNAVKCQVCVNVEHPEVGPSKKCWEIPCDSMPKDTSE